MAFFNRLGVIAAAAVILSQTAAQAALTKEEEGVSLQVILRDLNTTDWNRRSAIERILSERKAEAADALVNALDSSDPVVQANAAEIMSRLSGNWDFVISDKGLATILGIIRAARQDKVQVSLVNVLGHIGPRNARIQETLIELLSRDGTVSVRSACANALSQLIREEKTKDALPAVRILCKTLTGDLSPHVRSAAASALSQSHALPEVAVPALTAAIDDNYRQVRNSAIQAISRYGVKGQAAVPKVIEILQSESDLSIQQACIRTLQAIGRDDPEAVKALLECLDDPQLQSYALSHMSQMGATAAHAVPKLISIVETGSDNNKRIQAARVLAQLGPSAQSALPALEKIKDQAVDAGLKTSVEDAIRRISHANGSAAPHLIR